MDIQELMKSTVEQIPKTLPDGTGSSAKKRAEEKFYEAFREDTEQLLRKKAEKVRAESNLGERFARRTFESFDASKDQGAYDKALYYTEHYKDSERNCLMFVGDVGTGKTHLAASIANKLMSEGVPVLFDTFSGHLNKLKREFNGGQSIYLEKMQTVEMLMLDDIGKEKQTEWTRSIMFDVINYRYEHLLPIVMTTNLHRAPLEEYLGSAVWSRLVEMCSGVMMSGKDYRRNA